MSVEEIISKGRQYYRQCHPIQPLREKNQREKYSDVYQAIL